MLRVVTRTLGSFIIIFLGKHHLTMSFPPPTYVVQQQAGHPPDLPQPGFSLSEHSAQPYAQISPGQLVHLNPQPQDLAMSQLPSPLSHTEVQILKQQLDISDEKSRIRGDE